MLPAELQLHLEELLGERFASNKAVGGGDIHRAGEITTVSGGQFFVKYNTGLQSADMFRTEALGLALLGASRVIAVPKIAAQGSIGNFSYLLMAFIAPGPRTRRFWESFGQALATLHGTTSAHFGFSHDNFIGSLPQSNSRRDTWADFYTLERLQPQMRLARQGDLLDAGDEKRLDTLCSKLAALCPEEPPALTHGDLWSGNFLCDRESRPVLIDPAASFAHREMDMAMSRLFGGFDDVFYQGYEDTWPLEPGFNDRLEVYQLYYLLVHVNLFGGGYVESVRRILRHYA